jgi:hypothetical protein
MIMDPRIDRDFPQKTAMPCLRCGTVFLYSNYSGHYLCDACTTQEDTMRVIQERPREETQ